MQSVDTAADNIGHAALMPAAGLSPQRAWTLPATVAPIGSVVEALRHRTGHALRVAYGNAATHQPPLDAGTALALGFASDGDPGSLVDAVLARLARGGARATEPARPR